MPGRGGHGGRLGRAAGAGGDESDRCVGGARGCGRRIRSGSAGRPWRRRPTWCGPRSAGEAGAGAGRRWDEEVTLLLAERERLAAVGTGEVPVELPAQLSVSQLVALRRDPSGLARSLRRPMPGPPDPYARRGTAFHAWLEQRLGGDRLLDLDELPGAADEDAAPDEALAELRRRFLASEWADRIPVEVEVPFAMEVGGVVVRGRMDAVFRDESGFYDIVDWKTGRRPVGAAAEAAAVQLAAYRLAWAQLAGVPVEQVRARLPLRRRGRHGAPADLLDAPALAALISGSRWRSGPFAVREATEGFRCRGRLADWTGEARRGAGARRAGLMVAPVVREFAVVVIVGLTGLLLAGLVAFVPWYGGASGYAVVEMAVEPSPSGAVPR